MYHFFYIGTYSPQSTKVSLGYVVMCAKIYIWAKWDLGTLGGKYSFLQIYTDFVTNWLNIIEWHSHAARYRSLIMAINTKDHVSFHQKYWLYYGYILYPTSPQKYYAISKCPQSTLGVFCQFYSFFLMLQPHRPSPAMRNLALFKEPALYPRQTRFFHRPHLLAQDSILLDIQGHSWWHEPYAT